MLRFQKKKCFFFTFLFFIYFFVKLLEAYNAFDIDQSGKVNKSEFINIIEGKLKMQENFNLSLINNNARFSNNIN